MNTKVYSVLGMSLAAVLALAPASTYAIAYVDGSGMADTHASSSASDMHILDASVNADVNASANTNDEMGNDNGTSSESEDANAHGMMEANLHTNAAGVTVSEAAQVHSQADLDIFTQNAPMVHEHVAHVDTSASSSVAVDYKHNAKLFGFIPVVITSHTVVTSNADGGVQVQTTLPWWSALVTGGDFGTSVDSSLEESSVIKANASASLSADAKAQIAQAVIESLDAHTNAMMSGSVSTQ